MDRHNVTTQKLFTAPAQEEDDVESKIEDFESDSSQMDIEDDAQSPQVNIRRSYNIEGITIEFPYKPYQSQRDMMKSIIRGVKHGRHCLLESPTGTGKTAALLCSLRAWQIACKTDLNKLHSARGEKLKELKPPNCTCRFEPSKDNLEEKILLNERKSRFFKEMKLIRIKCEKTIPKRDKNGEPPNKMSKFAPVNILEERGVDDLCAYCTHEYLVDKTRPNRIYYGTRTHSQIAQIVKEIKNSPYCGNLKITVLGSRKNYCVNSELIKDPSSIDDECAKLKKNYFINRKKRNLRQKAYDGEAENKNANENEENKHANGNTENKKEAKKEKEERLPTCSYFENYRSEIEVPGVGPQGLANKFSGVRDIEDLKNDCGCLELCPYFISQALHEDAEIIILPYNYIIEPNIRKATGVTLTGSIVVLDEAHNIESSCMDAASDKVNLSTLNSETRRRLDEAIQFMPTLELEEQDNEDIWNLSEMQKNLGQISTFLKNLSTWLMEKDKKLFASLHNPGNPNSSDSVLIKMDEMLLEWKNGGMSEEQFKEIHYNLEGILDEDNEFASSFSSKYASHQTADPNRWTIPNFHFQRLLIKIYRFFCTLNFLYVKDDSKNLDDFVAILEHKCKNGNSASQRQNQCDPEINFHLRCLNPGLAFGILKKACHSVIVTSGTLSPMKSFSHELETEFRETLSANHAIPEKNVWASFFSPNSEHSINWNYIGQSHQPNLDILGDTILQIAEVVPKGILIFVPSYGFLDKLKRRWEMVSEQNGSLLSRLNIVKRVFFEIKDGKLNAEQVETYKAEIENGGGAIYFGVFRGKISEGVDFKGDHARAIISIGIPYQFVSSEVEAKKNYINKKKIQGYTGGVWYETEAFRAINQALGRCIRDINDWGALILLDRRFASVNYRQFSKWIKPKSMLDLPTLIKSLQEFVQDMQ